MLIPFVIALQNLDLDGDWDPEAHDRQMAGIYYAQDDDREFNDKEKPMWNDDIDIDDIVPSVASSSKKEKKRSKKEKKGGKDTVDKDEDYGLGEDDEPYGEDGEWDDEEWDGTEEMRKKKLQEYMDSLLELEFNDMASISHSNPITLFLNIPPCRLPGSPRDSSTPAPHHNRSG